MINKIKNVVKKKFTKNYWKSDVSCIWHDKRKKESYREFDIFAEAVSDKMGNFTFDTVIEIGTAGGTLITLLSKKINTCNKFIGIDINKHQIAENKKNYKHLSNVEFIYMDIEKYIRGNNLNNVVIVAQNTLDYFKKNELLELFLLIYDKIENVLIVVNTSKENKNLQNSIEREGDGFKVYDHNYYSLLKSAGYEMSSIDLASSEDAIAIAGYKLSK